MGWKKYIYGKKYEKYKEFVNFKRTLKKLLNYHVNPFSDCFHRLILWRVTLRYFSGINEIKNVTVLSQELDDFSRFSLKEIFNRFNIKNFHFNAEKNFPTEPN